MDQEEKKEKVKLNKTWILVTILVAITVSLLIISLTSKNPIPNPKAAKNIEKDVAHTTLDFSNDIRMGTSSARQQVDLNINTNGDNVTLAQIELSYDPNLLVNVDVVPGDFFDDAKVLRKSIDPGNGRITYWIGSGANQNGIKGNGSLAVISFTKVGSSPAQINFLPKTSVQAYEISKSVLKSMFSGIINNIVPTRPVSTRSAFPVISKP